MESKTVETKNVLVSMDNEYLTGCIDELEDSFDEGISLQKGLSDWTALFVAAQMPKDYSPQFCIYPRFLPRPPFWGAGQTKSEQRCRLCLSKPSS